MGWQTVLPHGFGRSACIEDAETAESLRKRQQSDIEHFHANDKSPKRVRTRIVKHSNDCYEVQINVDKAR